MPRIPAVQTREELAQEHRAVYDAIAASRGGVRGPFGVLLHSPLLAEQVANLGEYLRFRTHLKDAEVELAVIVVARELDCNYVWAAHSTRARQAGVREEAIAAIRNRQARVGLTSEEAQIVTYVQELLRTHRVTQPTFDAVQKRFGVAGLVELTTLAGYYSMVAGVLNASEVMPVPGADMLPD